MLACTMEKKSMSQHVFTDVRMVNHSTGAVIG